MSDDEGGAHRRDKFRTERRNGGGGGGKQPRGRSPDGNDRKRSRHQQPSNRDRPQRRDSYRGRGSGGGGHRRGGGGGNPGNNRSFGGGRRGPRFPPHHSPGFRGPPGPPRGPWKNPPGGPSHPSDPPIPALNLDKLKLNIRKFFDLHKDEAWFRDKYHPSVVDNKKETKKTWYQRRLALFKYLIDNNLLSSIDLSSKSQSRVKRLMTKINIALNTDYELWEAELPKVFQKAEPSKHKRKASTSESGGNTAPDSAAGTQEKDDQPATETNTESAASTLDDKNPPPADTSAETPRDATALQSEDTSEPATAQENNPQSGDASGAPAEEDQLDYNEDGTVAQQESVDVEGEAEAENATGRKKYITICCSGIPVTVSREDVVAAVSSIDGFVRLAIADPNQGSPTLRVAWLTFTKEVGIPTLLASVRGTPLEEHNLKFHEMKGGPGVVRISDAFRRKDDRALSITLGCLLDEEAGLFSDSQTTTNPYFEKERTDDEILLYLRIVHSYDFYNANEFLIENDLSDRCCTIHMRKNGRPGPDGWRARINQRIQLGKVTKTSSKKLGEVTVDGEKDRFLYKNSDKISEFVWRCKLHPENAKKKKMFKSKEFLAKHLANKHPQELLKVEEDTAYFNNYVHDPNRPLFFSGPDAPPLNSPPGGAWNPPPNRLPPPRSLRPPFVGPPPVFGSLSRRQVASYSGVTAPMGPAMI